MRKAGADDFHSLRPGGCNFPVRRRLDPVRQGDDQPAGFQLSWRRGPGGEVVGSDQL